jgi:hypothetical protein
VFFTKSPPLKIIPRSLAYKLSMNVWKRQGVRLKLLFFTLHTNRIVHSAHLKLNVLMSPCCELLSGRVQSE